ncbi:MAG TPA: urate hydroxylase PuuD [Planctomycetota bacterium]
MSTLFSADGVQFLLRWFHFLAGITWIGMLYYFNLVQTPFFKNADAAVRSGMVRGVVPVALWWFRWGAMFTFLTGWSMIMAKTHGEGRLPWDAPYVTLIMSGGLLGTLMWANVWFVIWPNQKVVIASAEQVAKGGQAIPEAAAKGATAGMASRTNFMLSIPMLFYMGAATHLPGMIGADKSPLGWWIAFAVLVGAMEWNALKGNEKTRKPLTTVKGSITLGIAVTVVFVVLQEVLLGASAAPR